MRTITATEKYRAVSEGKLAKSEFLRQMRQQFPAFITQFNGYSDTVQILKNKGIISEYADFKNKDGKKEKKATIEFEDTISPDVVKKGQRMELEEMGIKRLSDPKLNLELWNKAKEKALKNLQKDPNFYENKLAGIKNRRKNEVKKVGVKDTENAMKKVNESKETLKEGIFTRFDMKVKVPGYTGTIKRSKKGWMLFDKKGSPEEAGPFDTIDSLLSYYDLEVKDLSGPYTEKLKEKKKVEETDNLDEDHTSNPNDKYKVKYCKERKKDKWSVYEGSKLIKRFERKTEAQKYANNQNKKQKLNEGSMKSFMMKIDPNNQYSDSDKQAYLDSISADYKRGEGEKFRGWKASDFREDFENYVSNELDEKKKYSAKMEQKEEAEKKLIKESITGIVTNILSEQILNEASTSNLDKFVDYENEANPDLAARIRKSAQELEDYIGKLEKDYLDIREKIESAYQNVGPYMAPSLAEAFRKDLKPVLDKYFNIQIPKTNKEQQ